MNGARACVLIAALTCCTSDQHDAPESPAAAIEPEERAASQPVTPTAPQPSTQPEPTQPESQPPARNPEAQPALDAGPQAAPPAMAMPGAPAAASKPDAAAGGPTEPAAADKACDARKVEGPAGVYFHHIHYNTTDPEADLAFYEKHFDVPAIDFCTRPGGGAPTRATRTDRGYFLYTKVASPPDPTLNAYLEHVGWLHQDPAAELQRQVMLGAPLWPANPERGQCETAASGTQPCNDYWFYMQAPSGARVEVALGPGPATTGFGHIHLIMGEDLTYFETITNGRFANGAIDMVNLTDVLEDESYLDGEMVTDTRGKPIDHFAYSTANLEAERDRIKAAGIEITEDISFKPEYGFRSFFMKSSKGIWVEMVEDTAFAPQ